MKVIPFASLALGLLAIGCAARPTSVTTVDQSVLPAQAKALLSQDAQITRVEQETYNRGEKVYVIHYTLNGEEEKINFNSKDHSTPHGVFEINK